MSETIERSRQLLRRLCTAGRIMGWALVTLYAVGIGACAWVLVVPTPPQFFSFWEELTGITTEYLLTGLLVLGVVQFIRYLVEKECQPGWLLRKGHLVLYLFALCLLAMGISGIYPKLLMIADHHPSGSFSDISAPITLLAAFLSAMFPILTRALILVGMGLALRLVVPIVAESKTLV